MKRRLRFILIFALIAAGALAGYVQFAADNDKLTDKKVEDAWLALYRGDAAPIKALSCLEMHSEYDAVAQRTAELLDGVDIAAACDVFDDHLVCDFALTNPENQSWTEAYTNEVVDGKVCLPTED